jgi:hypothetical protein
MAPRKTRVRSGPTTAAPAHDDPSGRERSPETGSTPIEEGLNMWTRYARETGEIVTDFLRRFGEEQQKSYDAWAASLSESMRPKVRPPQAEAMRARLEEWNRQAVEVGARVREAFEKSLAPQRDLLEMWMKPFLPAEANVADQTREAMALVQKLWSGLTVDLTRRLVEAMQPEKGFDDFVEAQDEVVKQFAENFQKLTRIYFTSPAFVTTFGKTLDSSLDLQKGWKDSDELFRRLTGLPTRREIGELNQAVRDLSEQVSRLGGKRL